MSHTRFIPSLVLVLLVGCAGASLPAQAKEATVYIAPVLSERGVGAEQAFQVMLTPTEEAINTIGGELRIDSQAAEVVAIHTGESVVPLWIEAPRLEGNHVTFAGMFPGGYSGVYQPLSRERHDGIVFTVVLHAKEFGEATLRLTELELFKNDGAATPVAARTVPATFSVGGYRDQATTTAVRDTTPPQPFSVKITAHEAVHDGAYVAVFSARDAGSGIDHYELAEVDPQQRGALPESAWRRVDSPALLNDQARASRVLVKAVDRAGNERVESVPPRHPESRRFSSGMPVYILLISGILAAAALLYVVRRVLQR